MSKTTTHLEEFALIYSLPGSYEFNLISPNGDNVSFKIADFDGNEFIISGKNEVIELEDIGSLELHFKEPKTETTFDEYSDSFISAYSLLSKGDLEKIILSRLKSISFNTKEILNYLFYLKASNTKAFTYLLTSPETGTWIGATPEKLVEKKGENFHTMALAGTKPYEKDNPPVWAKKEIDEHEIVADDIEHILQKVKAEYKRSNRENHKSGQVVHLKTEFSFQCKNVNEFITELHPSSAVSGKPKQFSIESIKDIESHSRDLYTGLLGLEINDTLSYYVNLRCMQVHKEKATLYLGGGITKDSVLESEWEETEHKAKSLLIPLEKMQKFAGNDF